MNKGHIQSDRYATSKNEIYGTAMGRYRSELAWKFELIGELQAANADTYEDRMANESRYIHLPQHAPTMSRQEAREWLCGTKGGNYSGD